MPSKSVRFLCAAATIAVATNTFAQVQRASRPTDRSLGQTFDLRSLNDTPPVSNDEPSLASAPPGVSCAKTVLPNTNATSGNSRAPLSTFASSKCVYLITAAEMAAAGYANGSVPTTIGWSYQVAPSAAGSANLRVLLQNTTDVTNTKGTNFPAAIVGMTEVHNAATNLPNAVGPFDITLSTSASPVFTYSGGGLYVAFEWGPFAGPLTTGGVVWCNNTLAASLASSQSATIGVPASDTLGTSAFRPETRLNGDPNPINDAAPRFIYSLGSVSICKSGAQTIGAVIVNNGSATQTNLQVTLNVTGASTFTDTQTIPTLAGCGAVATVTFLPYTPSTLGNSTVTVSVPNDDVNANNSLARPTAQTDNIVDYKYAGSTAAGGAGLGVAGAFLGKFTTTTAATVEVARLEFFATSATTYRVAVYGDNAGVPALTPIYLDATDRTVTVAGPVSITLPSVPVPAGNFYVGIHQTNATNANYSFDNEAPIRPGSFFFAVTPVTAWTSFSPGTNFKLNVGVQLNPCPIPTGSCCVGTNCTIETAANCATLTGTYGGDGSTCTPDPCGPACSGDIFGPDGNVDTDDLLLLLATWGTPCTGGCEGDIVVNGDVDTDDLLEMLGQWGTPCNP